MGGHFAKDEPVPATTRIRNRRGRPSLSQSSRDAEGSSPNPRKPTASRSTRCWSLPPNRCSAKPPRVFIIPDGSLNALNFEALLAPDPTPHYWIEDVTLANASSLRLLERAGHASRADKRRMLLIGNPVAASSEFGTLPQAALEIENIRKRFPVSDQQVLAEAAATPAAYLAGKPEQFAYIHFVAHGTASRLSPLDSAIVLSKPAPNRTTLSGSMRATSFILRSTPNWSPSLPAMAPGRALIRVKDWSACLGPSCARARTT